MYRTVREEEIRQIAYGIWEADGQPEGRDLEHWSKGEAIWQERQQEGMHSVIPPPASTASQGNETKRSRR